MRVSPVVMTLLEGASTFTNVRFVTLDGIGLLAIDFAAPAAG